MTDSPSSAGTDVLSAPLADGRRRVRVAVRVRRRRARQGSRGHSKWTRSRRRALRTALVAAGLLLVMGTGLYLSLSLMGSPPANPRAVVRSTR
jgi:hypothetical protein